MWSVNRARREGCYWGRPGFGGGCWRGCHVTRAVRGSSLGMGGGRRHTTGHMGNLVPDGLARAVSHQWCRVNSRFSP